MLDFLQRHAGQVMGVLHGFDRMLFRGTQRLLATARGLMNYLWSIQVPLKEFGQWSEQLTQEMRAASEQVMIDADRPRRYLNDASASKEDLARQIALDDGIDHGPVCLLSSVEPCWSYELVRDRAHKKLVLMPRYRKCLHLYHYHLHEELGLMHVRLQTWLPFGVRVYINGREWLCRALLREGIGFERRENCLASVSDVGRAQEVLDGQLRTNWPRLLDGLERGANPLRGKLLRMEGEPLEYYWSLDQSEWASDVMFRSAGALAQIYPLLVRQGMLTMGAADVLRFLGKRLNGNVAAEVCGDLKKRVEGFRLKHRVGANSIKMYDKQRSVLRVETTINDASTFKVYRSSESNPDRKQWQRLRKGVCDLHRRAQVSQAANERYFSHLAAAETDLRLGRMLWPMQRAVVRGGRRFRGLRLLGEEDARLLAAVSLGEFAINGFRNAQIRRELFGPDGSDKTDTRRRSGMVSRKLALLHAHGLIKKVPRTRRWLLTEKGKEISTLLAALNSVSAKQLLEAA